MDFWSVDEQEYINTLTRLKGYFETHIGRAENLYYNYNLNCRYGIELDFFSSCNRYVLGNRVNNCMFNQNHEWWRNNYNALTNTINPNLPANPKRLTNDNNNFDEYSSFFIESSENHGAKTHRGNHRCSNLDNAGFRIEIDTSVKFVNQGPGVTLWSNKISDRHSGTDLKDKDSTRWNDNVRGLKLEVSTPLWETQSPQCSHHTLKSGFTYNSPDTETSLALFDENELVSNILTNEPVLYPLGLVSNDERMEQVAVRSLPLGSMAIDNLCNHIISHTTALLTQRGGFHVHLSEFPKIQDLARRKIMIIGFIKLFYVFEPLIFSFQPNYRSSRDYCQSLQSIFTRMEMLHNTDAIYDDLMADQDTVHIQGDYSSQIGGFDRKRRGQRYLSLNIQNCRENGIGTLEVRLAHTTFDPGYIQAYIHFLQTLFHLNLTLINTPAENPYPDHIDVSERIDPVRGGGPYSYHNKLLQSLLIPGYCDLTSVEYNNNIPGENDPNKKCWRAGQDGLRTRPVYGFFESMGNTRADLIDKHTILSRQYNMFMILTNSRDTLRYLSTFTNFYHSPEVGSGNWLSKKNINSPIDFGRLERQMIQKFRLRTISYNPFRHISMASRVGASYSVGLLPNGRPRLNLNHRCKTCAKNDANVCYPDFNNGQFPIINRIRRSNIPQDHRDEAHIYTERCEDRPLWFKSQSELLTSKLTNGLYHGGFKKSKNNRHRNINKKHSRKHKKMININGGSDNINYHINEGADRIDVFEKNGEYIAILVNWVGEETEIKLLSKIINKLIKQKIITDEQLAILVHNRYIDYYVFMTDTDIHIERLIAELSNYYITSQTIENIRRIYKETMPFQ